MGKSKEQGHKGARGFYVALLGLEPDSTYVAIDLAPVIWDGNQYNHPTTKTSNSVLNHNNCNFIILIIVRT